MFTIGKLAKITNSSVETIRYYQRIGLIKIPKATGKYRYYNQQDIDTLSFIQRAKDAGLQLSEIQELLALNIHDREKVRFVIEQRLEKINLKIKELESFKQQLSSWVDECKASSEPCCPILEALKTK
jgi:MerR family transcriptional regulator, mercuric resistance operon regulatory protein